MHTFPETVTRLLPGGRAARFAVRSSFAVCSLPSLPRREELEEEEEEEDEEGIILVVDIYNYVKFVHELNLPTYIKATIIYGYKF